MSFEAEHCLLLEVRFVGRDKFLNGLARCGIIRWTKLRTDEGSRITSPDTERHWPEACQAESPSGKRGVTTSLRNCVQASGVT